MKKNRCELVKTCVEAEEFVCTSVKNDRECAHSDSRVCEYKVLTCSNFRVSPNRELTICFNNAAQSEAIEARSVLIKIEQI